MKKANSYPRKKQIPIQYPRKKANSYPKIPIQFIQFRSKYCDIIRQSPDERRPAHGRQPEDVDIVHPNTGEVRSDGAEGIACWFIDTDHNEESFFVRHVYFLGANDPYKALKTTLKKKSNAET